MQTTDVKSKYWEGASMTGCKGYVGRGSATFHFYPKCHHHRATQWGLLSHVIHFKCDGSATLHSPNSSSTLAEMGVHWDKDVVLNAMYLSNNIHEMNSRNLKYCTNCSVFKMLLWGRREEESRLLLFAAGFGSSYELPLCCWSASFSKEK